MNSLFRITSRLLPFLVAPLFAHVDVSSYKNYVDSLIPGVRFGMAIRSVKTGQEIGNVNGDEQFTPASTLKTLTTAAAIHFTVGLRAEDRTDSPGKRQCEKAHAHGNNQDPWRRRPEHLREIL